MRITVEEAFKGGKSDPRNPLIHKMFSYLGYGERAGSGLSMINSVWKDKGWILPEINEEVNPNRTTLILYMKEEGKNNSSNYPNNYPNNYTNNCPNNYPNSTKLNKTQLEIIDIIRNNPIITVRELTEVIENITLSGVKWNLKWMKDNGLIERVGTTRKGQWIIKDKNIEMK